MELVHTEKDAQGIEYRLYIEQDDMPVRGNAMASGDDAADKATEDEIIERLDSGDTWAWAQTECVARLGDFEGVDYLGGCSYRDTAEFIQPGAYWDDMKHEARTQLLNQLEAAKAALESLR